MSRFFKNYILLAVYFSCINFQYSLINLIYITSITFRKLITIFFLICYYSQLGKYSSLKDQLGLFR